MNKLNLSFSKKQLTGYAPRFYFTVSFLIVANLQTLAQSDFVNINWSTAASQPYNVNEAQGEVVNGKLYSFGGFDSRKPCCTPTKRAYVYNPVANTWSAIADLPYIPNGANFGGVTHAGITTNGTDIFIAGGYTSNSTGTGQIFGTKQVWKYIVSQNSYIRLPDLPVSISAGQLEYLNNKLHHIGGTNSSRTADLGDHYVLDLNNTAAGWKTMALLPNPRQHAGTAVYGGKIYFIGGQHHHDGALMTQKDVHRFDPVANSWTKVSDLPVPTGAIGRGHISSGVTIIGERILVLGGETKHGTHTNMVSAYSPATNSWKNLTPLPANRYSGVAGTMNGNIYYCGGANSNTTYKGVPIGGGQQVISFTLINADTDKDIQTLNNGATLNLATLPSKNLNIRSNTSPAIVGSVVFALSGTQSKSQTESYAPYALYGNNGSNYNPWTPAVGNYTLKATPYSGSAGSGTVGTPLTINFSVVNSTTTQPLITNITSTTGRSYILSALTVGVTLYTDRSYQATTVPSSLNGQPLIKTPNDDKVNTSTSMLSFNLTQSATVYIGFDPRATALPAWLSTWQKLTDKIGINDPGITTLNLYSKSFPAGTVSLGGPRASPAAGVLSNYIVVAKANQSPTAASTSSAGIQPEQTQVQGSQGLTMQVYPNPVAGDKVSIAVRSQIGRQAVSISMYDASGKIIQSGSLLTDNNGTGRTEIPVRGINPGFYIIKAQSVSGKNQLQLIIE